MTIKRKFSPVRSDDRLLYDITGDVITIKHEKYVEPIADEEGNLVEQPAIETVDSFDFTGLPDGEADVHAFETTLPLNPFVSVKRVNGILEVEVINFIGANATEAERFPEWEEI